MLAVRLQRYGKTHFAVYRIVVQDAARSAASGKIVASVGNYNPHTKVAEFNREMVEKFIKNGAQPSPRVAKLLRDNGVKLPSWVPAADKKKFATRNPEKLRKNQPKEPVAKAEVAEEKPDSQQDGEAALRTASE